jgi:tRNA1Val (adenine37-N6)-methyltransferase
MKVTTDACLFGAWVAGEDKSERITAKNILDIGSGTGLLSLMYAQKNSSAVIDAIEIDKNAYEQAKENAASSSFAERIHMIYADVKTFSFAHQYDSIISNPPFYEKEIKSANEKKNIAYHHSGLVFEELVNVIKLNLSSTGFFYLLLPFKRNEEIRKVLIKQDLLILKMVFVRQSVKHNYFRIMLKGKLKNGERSETTLDEISVWNDQQQYTSEFRELLKDYYLNL